MQDFPSLIWRFLSYGMQNANATQNVSQSKLSIKTQSIKFSNNIYHAIFTHSLYSHTHSIFTHSLYIHPLTLYSHTHSIFKHSLYIHPLILYSPTHSIFTHSIHIHPRTLYSHTHSIFTHSLYIHTLYSPTHCICIHSLNHLFSLCLKLGSRFPMPYEKDYFYHVQRDQVVGDCSFS